MAIYRSVQLTFWTDEKVLDDFTPEDKYFYLYLFTNPQTNLIGCYELGWTATTSQLGYTKDTVLRLLERFENVHHVIRYSKSTKEVLLLNWWKYNCTKSPKLDKPLLDQIQNVKSSSFKMYLMEMYNERDRVEIGYQYPMDTTVTVTVNNNNINNNNINNNKLSSLIEIIDYLNLVTNSNYTYKNKSNNRHIYARLDEEHTVDEFKKVIDNMTAKWGNDPKMSQYLRPETLFGNKFESYLNMKTVSAEQSEKDKWLCMWEDA